jgi:hypothetical protein
MIVNGKQVLASGGLDVCSALRMEDVFYNWRTHRKGDAVYNADGIRVSAFEYLQEPEQGCPGLRDTFTLGQRLDIVVRLKGNGDGKAPTVVYLGKGSVAVQGNDC